MLIPALGATVGTGGEEDLEGRVWKDDSAHVSTIGHEPRRAAKAALQGKQGFAHGGNGGDGRSGLPDGFGAKLCRVENVSVQNDAARGKGHGQIGREPGQRVAVVQRHALLQCLPGGEAVEHARVEANEAQRLGHGGGDTAFAGGGGAVDGDDRHGPGDAGKVVEIAGVGLGHTARIENADVGMAEAGQRKTHGHAVIVVSGDGRTAPLHCGQGMHTQPVGAGFDLRPELGQFGGHGVDAVGFFHAPTADGGQRGGRVGEQRGHRQGHGRVGNGQTVDVAAAQRGQSGLQAVGFDKVVAPPHLGAEVFEHACKRHVALNAVAPHALHPHRRALAVPLTQHTRRQKIRGRRSIALHGDAARAAQTAARGNDKPLPPGAPHLHAKAPQQVEGDLDIGFGNQLALHRNGDVVIARLERQRQQQGGEKLAGDIAAHGHVAIQAEMAGPDVQRRIAFLPGVADFATELPQRIDQIADRALMHAGHAVQRIVTPQQRQRGGKRADRGARVAHEQIGLRCRKAPCPALHMSRLALAPHGNAQRLQRSEHHAGVVGIEQASDLGLPLGQRGEQQDAIGNALGTGQLHPSARADERRQIARLRLHHRTTPERPSPAAPGWRGESAPRPRSSCPAESALQNPPAPVCRVAVAAALRRDWPAAHRATCADRPRRCG